jgi:two-component system, NarL family, sensor histidine kinase DesK
MSAVPTVARWWGSRSDPQRLDLYTRWSFYAFIALTPLLTMLGLGSAATTKGAGRRFREGVDAVENAARGVQKVVAASGSAARHRRLLRSLAVRPVRRPTRRRTPASSDHHRVAARPPRP